MLFAFVFRRSFDGKRHFRMISVVSIRDADRKKGLILHELNGDSAHRGNYDRLFYAADFICIRRPSWNVSEIQFLSRMFRARPRQRQVLRFERWYRQ